MLKYPENEDANSGHTHPPQKHSNFLGILVVVVAAVVTRSTPQEVWAITNWGEKQWLRLVVGTDIYKKAWWGRNICPFLLCRIFLIGQGSVKCGLLSMDSLTKQPGVFTVPLFPNFGCIFVKHIHCSQTQAHYQHEEARRREAIDCVTFPQAPGCEDSLWVRLSITDSGSSTWKDSMYKAAGAEGESCMGIQTPLLCPAVFYPTMRNPRCCRFQTFLICLLISVSYFLVVCTVLGHANNISYFFNAMVLHFFREILSPLTLPSHITEQIDVFF